MNKVNTQCCAVQELTGLRGHASAREAFDAFCLLVVGFQPQYKGIEYYDTAWRKDIPPLSGHYTFTGVIKYTGPEAATANSNYVNNFATFLRENNLGPVVDGPEAPNRINHPFHVDKVCVWAPDQAAVNAWWHANMERLLGPKPKSAAQLAAEAQAMMLEKAAQDAKAKEAAIVAQFNAAKALPKEVPKTDTKGGTYIRDPFGRFASWDLWYDSKSSTSNIG